MGPTVFTGSGANGCGGNAQPDRAGGVSHMATVLNDVLSTVTQYGNLSFERPKEG